ncbi:unnamed protein product [Anisakis simplex]|uniref:MIF4G domain-containing protein n=1 Tax=Anisakis simplex TaxID=6269 RepID=A0A0M3KHU5_ANISI|nr:unnamed protein product [Anisakis simplex]
MRLVNGQRLVQSLDPLSESVSRHIAEYCRRNSDEEQKEMEILMERVPVLRLYLRRYQGLDNALFVLCKWAELQKLFEAGTLRKEHICMLFLLFGLNQIGTVKSSLYSQMLEKTVTYCEDHEVRDMNEVLGGLGKCLLRFLRYLSSRAFETKKMFNFMNEYLQYGSVLLRGQWVELQKAATKTFYKIVLTSRFDDLPIDMNEAICRNELVSEQTVCFIFILKFLQRFGNWQAIDLFFLEHW